MNKSINIKLQNHYNNIISILNNFNIKTNLKYNEITIIIKDQSEIHQTLKHLKSEYCFEQLTDITAVDYLTYKQADWQTGTTVSETTFSRGRHQNLTANNINRFEIIYQLLSITNNVRIRVKCKLNNADIIIIDSISDLWSSANWSEREVYDMFGIYFKNHPDLRRILTDYSFVGHPLRKDFPQTGYMEMRYDNNLKKVIYEKIEIDNRINTPKVIRK